MERKYVKIVALSLFFCFNILGCNQLNRTNVEPETSSITEEIQQANIEEQKKKQYKENIARYVFVKEQMGTYQCQIWNNTEYTVEKVEISAWDYDFDLHEHVEKKVVITFIPAGSYREFESSLSPQITYIKCTALGMY